MARRAATRKNRGVIEYRAAGPSDADAIALLHTRSWRESFRGIFPDAFLDEALPGERIRVWRERLGAPPASQRVELAVEAAGLVGFVCAYGAHDPRWGSFVDNLHVAGEARGRGVGSALLRRAGGWLAEHYPEAGVYLLVLEQNEGARRLYERLGARSAEVAPMETHGGGRARTCRYVWSRAKELAEA